MSRMSAERSSTVLSVISSSTRICEGESSLSKIIRSASLASASSLTSCALPSPMKVRASGAGRVCSVIATVSAPAVSTNAASSARVSSSAFSSMPKLWHRRPTSTARSFFGLSNSISIMCYTSFPGLCRSRLAPLPGRPLLTNCSRSIIVLSTWYSNTQKGRPSPVRSVHQTERRSTHETTYFRSAHRGAVSRQCADRAGRHDDADGHGWGFVRPDKCPPR